MRVWVLPTAYWAIRDWISKAGIVYLAIGGTIGVVVVRAGAAVSDANLTSTIELGLVTVIWLGVLVQTAGIVSNDHRGGYYRIIFSQPISRWGYYLTKFLVGGAGTLLFGLALLIVVYFGRPSLGIRWEYLSQLMSLYVLLGGTVFLLSTLMARDSLVAGLFFWAERNVAALVRSLEDSTVWNILLWVFPPFHLHEFDVTIEVGATLLMTGYGVGLVAAATLVLRFKPLATIGRPGFEQLL